MADNDKTGHTIFHNRNVGKATSLVLHTIFYPLSVRRSQLHAWLFYARGSARLYVACRSAFFCSVWQLKTLSSSPPWAYRFTCTFGVSLRSRRAIAYKGPAPFGRIDADAFLFIANLLLFRNFRLGTRSRNWFCFPNGLAAPEWKELLPSFQLCFQNVFPARFR